MFDIGFSELFVVAIVALLVLGPERLPRAARMAGLWVRRARAQWYSVKSELENELADEELKRSLRQTQAELTAAREQLRAGGAALQREFQQAESDLATPNPDRAPPPQRDPGPHDPDGKDDPGQGDPDRDSPERRDPGLPAPPVREPDPRETEPTDSTAKRRPGDGARTDDGDDARR